MSSCLWSNPQLYSNGETVISNVVLSAFRQLVRKWKPEKDLTTDTKILTEDGFTLKEIALVLFQTRKSMLIPFLYDLLPEQDKDATIGSLTKCSWKNMLKAIQYN